MLITAAGIPFVFAYNGICSILRGFGESKRPLLFIVVAATINIFLDLLLVVCFHMGASGTAVATVASQIGASAAAFIYMYRHRHHFEFKLDIKNFPNKKTGSKGNSVPWHSSISKSIFRSVLHAMGKIEH